MSLSLTILKPVTCRISPVTGENGSNWEVPKVKLMKKQAPPHLQVLCKATPSRTARPKLRSWPKRLPCHQWDFVTGKERTPVHQTISSTSRRDLVLLASSLGLVSFLLPPRAQAGWERNAAMRKKIMQKLENLRQKAGLPKPRNETEEKKPDEESEARKTKVGEGIVETTLKFGGGDQIEKPLKI